MTTNHLKMGVEPTPEMSCISNIPQTVDNVQHSIHKINQPLLQTFRESLGLYKHEKTTPIKDVLENSIKDSKTHTLENTGSWPKEEKKKTFEPTEQY
jgi:hypothetical protein